MHDTPAPPPTATTTTTGVALFGLFLTVTTPLSMASPAVPSAHISNSHLWKDGPVEVEARQTVEAAEAELLGLRSALAFAEWNFRANLGDVEGEQRRADAQQAFSTALYRHGRAARDFLTKLAANETVGSELRDQELKRKMRKLALLKVAALPDDKLARFNDLTSLMVHLYSSGFVPPYDGGGGGGTADKDRRPLPLSPNLEDIMATSRDPNELRHYWERWRDSTGRKIAPHFSEYVSLLNDAAVLNGFNDAAEMAVADYDDGDGNRDSFAEEMDRAWEEIRPLYHHLHAFVRNRLVQRYGEDVVPRDKPIPAHLLGDMWAQVWTHVGLSPYPEWSVIMPEVMATEGMSARGYTPKVMFQKADDFYQSLGFPHLPKRFWEDSIMERPGDGRSLSCHAAAFDFFNGEDFRIRQCAQVGQAHLSTVIHEMGHIHYFLSYRDQSYLFRDGANPAFHEAIADALSLAETPGYYQQMGLIERNVDVYGREVNLNLLFAKALRIVAFLPFAYLLDKYRWDLYSGRVDLAKKNCHYVKYRLDIQGVSPPLSSSFSGPRPRTESDFDAGCKYHVAAGAPYARYFAAFILQFQIYRALCQGDDVQRPMHQCTFFGRNHTVERLKPVLELGASKPWREALQLLSGEKGLDGTALRQYFQPLEEWLAEQNKKNELKVGWTVKDYGAFCEGLTSNTSGTTTATWTLAYLLLLWSIRCNTERDF